MFYSIRSFRGVVVKLLDLKISLSDDTLNRGPITIFQDKLLTRTYCDEPHVEAPLCLVG